MIKSFNKLDNKLTHLKIIKTIYDKCIDNIVLNIKKLKAFLLRSERRQVHLFSPVLFSINWKYQQRKSTKLRNKRHPNKKKRSEIIVYWRRYYFIGRNSRDSTKKLLELIKSSKVTEYKITCRNQLFLTFLHGRNHG